MNRKILLSLVALAALAACDRPADVASRNISQAADNFEVNRRITFMNTWKGDSLLTIEGLCSLGNEDTNGKLSVTCKVGPGQYKKHFLGLSSNVTFVVEQIEPNPASIYHYRVVFNPSTIIPDIRMPQ